MDGERENRGSPRPDLDRVMESGITGRSDVQDTDAGSVVSDM